MWNIYVLSHDTAYPWLTEAHLDHSRIAIRGQLSSTAVADVLATVEASSQSAEVRIRGETGAGTIWFKAGCVVDAEIGPLTGESAFIALLGLDTGTFEVVHCPVARSVRIRSSVKELLAQGARRRREWLRWVDRTPGLASIVEVNEAALSDLGWALETEELELVGLVDGKRLLLDIVSASGRDAVHVLSQLVTLAEAGALRLRRRTGWPETGDDGVTVPKAPRMPSFRQETLAGGVGYQSPQQNPVPEPEISQGSRYSSHPHSVEVVRTVPSSARPKSVRGHDFKTTLRGSWPPEADSDDARTTAGRAAGSADQSPPTLRGYASAYPKPGTSAQSPPNEVDVASPARDRAHKGGPSALRGSGTPPAAGVGRVGANPAALRWGKARSSTILGHAPPPAVAAPSGRPPEWEASQAASPPPPAVVVEAYQPAARKNTPRSSEPPTDVESEIVTAEPWVSNSEPRIGSIGPRLPLGPPVAAAPGRPSRPDPGEQEPRAAEVTSLSPEAGHQFYVWPPAAARAQSLGDSNEVFLGFGANAGPRVGENLLGRYDVICELGQGRIGSVYLCRIVRDAGIRRLCAVRVFRNDLPGPPESSEYFLQKAAKAARVHHPNVVSVFDATVQDGQLWVVMDYVEGCSLHTLLEQNPTYRPPELILPAVLDALNGLHAIHTLTGEDGEPLGLIHGNVSPKSLLVGVDGACRVSDLAFTRGTDQQRSGRRGEEAYLAPERCSDGPVDQRADIYSMGVVLYNALTGVNIFQADTEEATIHQLQHAQVLPPSRVGVHPPEWLDELCLRALARDPRARFSSADEMMFELKRIAARHELFARVGEAGMWVRRTVGSELQQRRLALLDGSRRTSHAIDPALRARSLPAESQPSVQVAQGTHALAGSPGTAGRAPEYSPAKKVTSFRWWHVGLVSVFVGLGLAGGIAFWFLRHRNSSDSVPLGNDGASLSSQAGSGGPAGSTDSPSAAPSDRIDPTGKGSTVLTPKSRPEPVVEPRR